MKNLFLRIRFTWLVLIGYFFKSTKYYYPSGFATLFVDNFMFGFDEVARKIWQPCEEWGCVKDGENPYIIWKDEQREAESNGVYLITDINSIPNEPEIKSGQLCSWKFLKLIHGRYRAMMKVPPLGGQYWWAMWLIQGNGEEIDIEFMDDDSKGFTCTLFAMINSKKTIVLCKHFRTNVDLSNAFHFYEIDWQKDYVAWYLDGIKLCEYSGKYVPQVPLGLIINNAVKRGFKPSDVSAEKLKELFPVHGVVQKIEVLEKIS